MGERASRMALGALAVMALMAVVACSVDGASSSAPAAGQPPDQDPDQSARRNVPAEQVGAGNQEAPPPQPESSSVSRVRNYNSFEELLEEPNTAALLAVVTGVDEADVKAPGLVPFTNSTLRVTEVLARDPALLIDATISVRQTGGTAGGRTVSVDDERMLQPGDEVLLFLTFDPSFGLYVITGGGSGHFLIEGDAVRHATHPGGGADAHPLAAAVQGRTLAEVHERIAIAAQRVGAAVGPAQIEPGPAIHVVARDGAALATIETRRDAARGSAVAFAWSPDGARLAITDALGVSVLELADGGVRPAAARRLRSARLAPGRPPAGR